MCIKSYENFDALRLKKKKENEHIRGVPAAPHKIEIGIQFKTNAAAIDDPDERAKAREEREREREKR